MNAREYNVVVETHADHLFRFVLKQTGGAATDSEDIVQTCYEILWEKKKSLPSEKAKAFLFQVAYHKCMDWHRAHSRIAVTDIMPEQIAPAKAHPDLKKWLNRALEQLDKQSRALVLLKDLEGYSYQEIATITGLNETQVKVYLHRARKTLKTFLGKPDHVL